MPNEKVHVVLLKGGLSSEREVSLTSGNEIAKALRELGYRVTEIDMQRDLATVLTQIKPDLVFNGLHGTYGEDGCVPGLLEILGIPYTHSGVLASALAMNKQQAKAIFEKAGILCPMGKMVHVSEFDENQDPMPRPYVIKPVSEGSSVGVFIIEQGSALPNQKTLSQYATYFLAERYIPGKELSVAVTDDGPLGVLELVPKEGFYNYENKYTDGMTEHQMPANVPQPIYDEAMRVADQAHHLLGCSGLSRSDFRYDHEGDGKLYLLELNTHPGMTPLSIAPEIANYKGINFNQLIQYLVEKATCERNI